MSREDILERGLRSAMERRSAQPCPGEEALVAFYRGRLAEAESESIREHLAACAECVALARDARRFLEAMETAPRPSRWIGVGWLAAAAALLLAAFTGLWMARQGPAAPAPAAPEAAAPRPSNRWRDLPVKAAAYRPVSPEDELVFRSGAERGGGDFAKAMISYTRGDYPEAEVGLARYLETHPGDVQASFYRGVSLLILGRPEEARPLLASASASKRPPEEARWYLALSALKSGDEAEALLELDAVARMRGPDGAEAARLAEEVRRAVGLH